MAQTLARTRQWNNVQCLNCWLLQKSSVLSAKQSHPVLWFGRLSCCLSAAAILLIEGSWLEQHSCHSILQRRRSFTACIACSAAGSSLSWLCCWLLAASSCWDLHKMLKSITRQCCRRCNGLQCLRPASCIHQWQAPCHRGAACCLWVADMASVTLCRR